MVKYEFTHEDYLMYEFHFVNMQQDEILGTASKLLNQRHDKTFKEVLKDKKEMSAFLKYFIELEVDINKLQIYNNEFINNKYEKRISDIIYKEKEKEIYYLIEHQSRVDINMPNRILEYCMELMREAKKNIGEGINPLIVPIVIYTGSKEWTVSENFSDTQKVEKKYKKYAINLKYKLIDINKYSREELTNKNTKITSMMLLEKCKNDKEIRTTIMQLWENANKERREWLANLIKFVFSQMSKDEVILKLMNEKEKTSMEDWIERMKENRRKEDIKLKRKAIREGRAEGREQGIKETINLIIKNMLKEHQDESTIIRFTNAKKEDIEKVKQELNMQIN